jgi:hypothetical protein
MKTKAMITMLVGVAMIFTAPVATFGAGSPGGSGGSGTAQAAGALYGDLYVIERDGNGAPVMKSVTYFDSGTNANVTVLCQQPLAKTCALLPLWGESVGFDSTVNDPCSVHTDFTDQLQAVSFGRESVSRAPATVIDKAYGEALKSINLAAPNCGDSRAIKLDPAGRITLCIPQETAGTYAWKTIDAPLENLGLYRAAMTTGCFGPVTDNVVSEEGVRILVTIELSVAAKGYLNASALGHLVCGTESGVTKKDMLSAAVFLAAGADKESPVTLDEIINLNTYLGVNKWTYTTVRKVKTLSVTYFQFKVNGGPGGWFGYTNGIDACIPSTLDTTVALLITENGGTTFKPANVDVFGDLINGVDLTTAEVTVCRKGFPLQNVVCDNAGTDPVYSSESIYGCGGANWFAQAAEDARKTIWYLHNWRLPVVAY